ncbi:MAG TPA: hypothetical protein VGO56_00735 [Pyrinomonadaceae bacterium]|jgi:hypothetical protein|nr:hypothetical protein [Pyrinomonadaceae bacterium]
MTIGGFKLEVQRCNPEGCEKVAGGRSAAKDSCTTSRYGSFGICSGGFRFASTTGYYLRALRADALAAITLLRFKRELQLVNEYCRPLPQPSPVVSVREKGITLVI